MARKRHALRGWSVSAAIGLLSAAAVLLIPSLGRAANPSADVAAMIAAGEFGPALAIAGATNDPALRDKMFANIAAAQARIGARPAAMDTVSSMSGDLARKAALGSMSADTARTTAAPQGARGGGSMADFQSLIDLIQNTVATDSWFDIGGGPGAIDSFEGGVFVDSAGLLKKLPPSTDRSLIAVHRAAVEATQSADPRRATALRKVSLNRLEREVQLLAAQGREPSEAMRTLAGIKRVKYILLYPESGDIVLAGPAGDWRRDAEGRYVDETGAPVLNLDDLVVTLRNAYTKHGQYGCSIDPRQDNLAAAKAVNEKWSAQALKPGQRERWLSEFRDAMGRQDIRIYGIDPRTRTGRVLIEADYRMKLVGIGLEEGTLGVRSYLSTVELGKDGKPPPMNVLRWWFTLNYDALSATEGRDAFELRGPGVKVLSENEFLTEQGERVHTGASDELTSRFAESFTKHFDKLSVKYPIYAELRNVFDLSLVAAVIHSHDMPNQIGWHMTHFGPSGDYSPELGPAPTEVESVLNHRVIGGRHVVAAVSGGVRVDTNSLANKGAVKKDTYGLMSGERTVSTPTQLPRRAWWWD